MIETQFAGAFIHHKLSTDAGIVGAGGLNGNRIYYGYAPQKTTYPLVIYNLQPGTGGDINSANQQARLISSQQWQVRVVTRGIPTDAARSAAHRIDELFRNVRREAFSVGGQTLNFNTWRNAPVDRQESGEMAEVFYENIGGLYQVQVFS